MVYYRTYKPGALGFSVGFLNCICKGGGIIFLSGSAIWKKPTTLSSGFCSSGTWGNSNFCEGCTGLNCSKSFRELWKTELLLCVCVHIILVLMSINQVKQDQFAGVDILTHICLTLLHVEHYKCIELAVDRYAGILRQVRAMCRSHMYPEQWVSKTNPAPQHL